MYFYAHFVMLFLVFNLRLHFIILLTLTSYFFLFFVSLKKFGLFFHRLNELIWDVSSSKQFSLPLFKLVVCLLTNLFVKFSFWKFLFIFCKIFLFFSETYRDFQTGSINCKTAYSSVCLHTPLESFFSKLSPSEKSHFMFF